AAGVPTAAGIRVTDPADPALHSVAFPAIVKPTRAGSSHGVAVVRTASALADAVRTALALADSAMVEEFVTGREIDLAVIEHADGALHCAPALEIGVPEGGIFDTAGKYDGEPDFRVP